MKKLTPILFILGLVLSLLAISVINPGWLRQTVLFLGVVSAITGMIFRIVTLLKSN